ncbi:hypothetical protein DFH09DRAFT_1087553 [Mycena vulgaris]|nr:hypothetical protein DFH09DRAFT_1087553 [Mycena vulgaris]
MLLSSISSGGLIFPTAAMTLQLLFRARVMNLGLIAGAQRVLLWAAATSVPRAPQGPAVSALQPQVTPAPRLRAGPQLDLHDAVGGPEHGARGRARLLPPGQCSRCKSVALAAHYYAAEANKLCLLNITFFCHSLLQNQPMLAIVPAAAERLFILLTTSSRIKDSVDPDGMACSMLEITSAYFHVGADKVSIGSEVVNTIERLRVHRDAADRTSAIETIAHTYGRQAVVVSIDLEMTTAHYGALRSTTEHYRANPNPKPDHYTALHGATQQTLTLRSTARDHYMALHSRGGYYTALRGATNRVTLTMALQHYVALP